MKAQLRKVIPAMLALFTLNAAAVTRYVDLHSPSPTPPYTNWGTAATNIQDAIDVAMAGDTVLVTNGVYYTGGKAVYGAMTNRVAVDKPLTLMSVNGPEFTFIQGYQLAATTNGIGAVRCVYLTNGAFLSGFTLTNGATLTGGSTTLEQSGGGLLCESTNAWASNCFLVGNAAAFYGGGAYSGTLFNSTLRGNMAKTGGGAYYASLHQCVLMVNAAMGGVAPSGGGAFGGWLFNCNLSSNSARFGGGARYGRLTNCNLRGNSAVNDGGGTDGGTMIHCILVGNVAANYGGGASSGSLINCTLVGNSADVGGGAQGAGLQNCIVYYNTAASSGENHSATKPDNTCTTPLPSNGTGHITNAPLFVDTNGWADLRLQSNSPCINAGNNRYVSTDTDLDGNPRIAGGTVDIGPYEYQSPASILSYVWAQQNGLPTDGSADFADNDRDGANNWHEWRADTIPTNALSVLKMINALSGSAGLNVTWQSVSTRNYWLERATNFADVPPFQTIATNIAGASGLQTYTDATATNSGPYFYRVGIQP